MYVTPEKYRTMGFGIDLVGIEDFELASILNRARTISEAYCAVSQVPAPHSFIGGTATDEQHSWKIPENDFDVGQRRIYPYHWPIREILDFRVKVTNTQYVTIAPSEIFINNTDRYIEVISLAFTGVGLFGAILPSIGLMRPVAQISYTYGHHFEVTDEIVYATDARTYRAQNQFWHAPEETGEEVVTVNGVVKTLTTDYTVDRVEGTVLFNAPLATADANKVKVNYHYTLPTNVRDANGEIATYLLGDREMVGKGFGGGVQSIKVDDVSITRQTGRRQSLNADGSNLPELCPGAAALLYGHKFITVRG